MTKIIVKVRNGNIKANPKYYQYINNIKIDTQIHSDIIANFKIKIKNRFIGLFEDIKKGL